jgi:hypothetical protein
MLAIPVAIEPRNMTIMIRFCCGQYSVSASVGELPSMYSHYVEHAVLNEDFGIRSGDGTALFFSVASNSGNWPELVVALRFEPSPEGGFDPGFLLIPERHLILVGAGPTPVGGCRRSRILGMEAAR